MGADAGCSWILSWHPSLIRVGCVSALGKCVSLAGTAQQTSHLGLQMNSFKVIQSDSKQGGQHLLCLQCCVCSSFVHGGTDLLVSTCPLCLWDDTKPA